MGGKARQSVEEQGRLAPQEVESGGGAALSLTSEAPQGLAPQGLGGDLGLSVSDILEALPFYVMLVDDEHHILLANRAVQEHLGVDSEGCEPGAIVGGYCPQVIHGLDRPWPACPLEEAVQKGRPVEREAFDESSGRWVRSAIYPVKRRAPDGRRVYFHFVSDITEAKEAEAQLRASRARLRELSRHLESIREDERAKVAREIHDELGQALTALKIDLFSLARRFPRDQEVLFQKTDSMVKLIDEAIQTVKRISTELRPGALDDLGLPDALEWLTHEFGRRTGIRATFGARPRDMQVDRERSTAVFRICQEALTNVARHAEATRVAVSIRKTSRSLRLRVEDDGKGIDQEQVADPRAFGLIGMRERACLFGGEVKIVGSPGEGTAVMVAIPLGVKGDAEC
jgi:PAS domain S-box-containing protein